MTSFSRVERFSPTIVSTFLVLGVLMIWASRPQTHYQVSELIHCRLNLHTPAFLTSLCPYLDSTEMCFGCLEAPVVHSIWLRLDFLLVWASIDPLLWVYVESGFDWFGWSWVNCVPKCRFVEYDIPTYSYLPSRGVEAFIPLLFRWVPQEDTFL